MKIHNRADPVMIMMITCFDDDDDMWVGVDHPAVSVLCIKK